MSSCYHCHNCHHIHLLHQYGMIIVSSWASSPSPAGHIAVDSRIVAEDLHLHHHCHGRHYHYCHDQQQDHCMIIAILIVMNHHDNFMRRPPWRQNASRNYRKGRPIHPFLSHHTLNNKHGEDNDYKNIISDGCSIVDGWMVNWVRYNSYIEPWAI